MYKYWYCICKDAPSGICTNTEVEDLYPNSILVPIPLLVGPFYNSSILACIGPPQYNTDDWFAFLQVRVAFEEFSGHATQMLSRLEEMQETVSRKDFPQDLDGARRMIEEHATLKKKVIKAPIEELDTEGQR